MIKVGDDVVSTVPNRGPARPGLPIVPTPAGGTAMVDPLKPEPRAVTPPPPAIQPAAAAATPPAPPTLATEPKPKAAAPAKKETKKK